MNCNEGCCNQNDFCNDGCQSCNDSASRPGPCNACAGIKKTKAGAKKIACGLKDINEVRAELLKAKHEAKETLEAICNSLNALDDLGNDEREGLNDINAGIKMIENDLSRPRCQPPICPQS